MRTDEFKCVEMKRRGAEEVRKKLAGMTRQQQLEYWRQRTQELRELQARLRAARGMSAPGASR